MTNEYSLEEIEALNRVWTDKFALKKGWVEFNLSDPVDDLALFFKHIPGKKTLDVGCGWGRYVYRFLDEGLSYSGIDHSLEMIRLAQEENPDQPFTVASFRALPYPDDTFDGLWSCCALSAIPKSHLVTILSEHRRVLKPGGMLLVVMPAHMPVGEEMYTNDDGSPSIYQSSYDLPEFSRHILDAGFTIIESDYRYQNGSMYVLAQK